MINILLTCLLLSGITIEPKMTIAEQCQNNTVIVLNQVQGSGVLFTRTYDNGTKVTFVWTAAHLANSVMQSNGSFRKLIIISGNKQAQAIVLRASDNSIDHDIALLQIIDSNDFQGDAKFYQMFNHIKVGQSIIHVGTPRGKIHECSVFRGIISYVDRKYNMRPVFKSRLLDQINVTVLPGCSGGGVFDAKDGGILGFVSLGSAETIGFITPTRYIYEWAKSHDCLWAFDRNIPLPVNIIPWRGDLHAQIIATRNTIEIDARWGEPIEIKIEPEPVEIEPEIEIEIGPEPIEIEPVR